MYITNLDYGGAAWILKVPKVTIIPKYTQSRSIKVMPSLLRIFGKKNILLYILYTSFVQYTQYGPIKNDGIFSLLRVQSSLFFLIFSLVAFFSLFWAFFNFLPFFINLLQIVAKTEHNLLKFTLFYVKFFHWIVNFVQNANYIRYSAHLIFFYFLQRNADRKLFFRSRNCTVQCAKSSGFEISCKK